MHTVEKATTLTGKLTFCTCRVRKSVSTGRSVLDVLSNEDGGQRDQLWVVIGIWYARGAKTAGARFRAQRMESAFACGCTNGIKPARMADMFVGTTFPPWSVATSTNQNRLACSTSKLNEAVVVTAPVELVRNNPGELWSAQPNKTAAHR
jgi:hypothetical protein